MHGEDSTERKAPKRAVPQDSRLSPTPDVYSNFLGFEHSPTRFRRVHRDPALCFQLLGLRRREGHHAQNLARRLVGSCRGGAGRAAAAVAVVPPCSNDGVVPRQQAGRFEVFGEIAPPGGLQPQPMVERGLLHFVGFQIFELAVVAVHVFPHGRVFAVRAQKRHLSA